MARAAELEVVPAQTTFFSEGQGPVQYLRVIRRGAVEIVDGGRVLDLLGEGELFGQASMLSGFPPGFEARAAEETVCYRIPAEVAEELLGAPAGLRFVARSLLEPPTDLHLVAREPARNLADQPVGTLLRGRHVVCAPGTSITEAARQMTAAQATCTLVDLGAGRVGIVTDRDLRTKVVAGGLPADTPVSDVMSAPAYSATADRRAGDLLIEMLDRGLRHFPVLSATGSILGVIEDVDLVELRTRSSFYLRQRISVSRSVSELVTVGAELRPMICSLSDARVAAANAMAVYSVSVDALTRRMLELELERLGDPGVEFAWLALGSLARREAVPSSDVDSAIVWFDQPDEAEAKEALLELARAVTAGLVRCGLQGRRERGDRIRSAVRALARILAAGGAQLDRGADPGEGADPLVGARRQPPGVGRAHRHSRGRHIPVGRELADVAADDGALRALAPPADGLGAGIGGRAERRAARPPRPQTRRCAADRRSRALGRDGRRRDRCLHGRAAAGRRRGRNAVAG